MSDRQLLESQGSLSPPDSPFPPPLLYLWRMKITPLRQVSQPPVLLVIMFPVYENGLKTGAQHSEIDSQNAKLSPTEMKIVKRSRRRKQSRRRKRSRRRKQIPRK